MLVPPMNQRILRCRLLRNPKFQWYQPSNFTSSFRLPLSVRTWTRYPQTKGRRWFKSVLSAENARLSPTVSDVSVGGGGTETADGKIDAVAQTTSGW